MVQKFDNIDWLKRYSNNFSFLIKNQENQFSWPEFHLHLVQSLNHKSEVMYLSLPS